MTNTARRLPTLALVAGVAYALTGAVEIGHEQAVVFDHPADYVIEYTFAAALALGAMATASLARTNTRAARAAWAVATVGHTVLFVAALITALRGRESLDPVFPLGVLLILLAAITLSILAARRRAVPPRAGVALLAGFVGAMVLDPLAGAGSLALAAAWIAIARLLNEETQGATYSGADPEQPGGSASARWAGPAAAATTDSRGSTPRT